MYKGRYDKAPLNSPTRNIIDVAVKSLKAEMVAQFQKEFEDEVKTMGALDHPNIVKLIGQCHRKDNGKLF